MKRVSLTIAGLVVALLGLAFVVRGPLGGVPEGAAPRADVGRILGPFDDLLFSADA